MHRREFVLTAAIATAVASTIRGAVAQSITRPSNGAEAAGALRMQTSANRLFASLGDAQRQALMFPLAAEECTVWSNLPAANVPRIGIRVGDLGLDSRRHLHELMRASASSQGYMKMAGIMRHDEVFRTEELAWLEHNPPKPRTGRDSLESTGADNYWVAVFGDPRINENWGWLLTGHHLAATFTRAGMRTTFLPLFLGAAPQEVKAGSLTGARVLSHEATRAFDLLHALTPELMREAVVAGDAINDVLTGAGRRDSLTAFEGLPASRMDVVQQRLLWALVEEYVRNADFGTADAQLDAVRAEGLDALYFSWRGPTDDPDRPFYYRVHGPRLIIEYAMQEPNHIHTITRDPVNDYGMDWLSLHYEEHLRR